MFGDQVYEGQGFESSWKDEKDSSNQSVQTTEFKTKEQYTSTVKSTTIQTQTEDNHSDVIESVDMTKLASWLKNVCPGMMNELNDMSVANAMASLKLNDNSSAISANLLQEIDTSSDETKTIHVSAISWNSTGNTLAVASCFAHETWCHHQGVINLYTFDRQDTLPSSPTKKLNCESCVTALSFHPDQPSTLCAGTISGEIYLWNNQKDEGDNLIGMVAGHDDRISLIQWITTDTKKSVSTLATAGLDSYLLLWDVSVEDIIFKIKQRYTTGKVNKSITSPEVYSRKSEGGIIYFDFSPFISGLFVIGLEGGALTKCSTLGAKSLLTDETDSTANILDPSVSNYEKHEGEITSIKFSPHRKELFLSCGTDNEIRIFHIDQVTPTQIIFMEVELNAVDWVIHEEKICVGCGEKGSIKLFSLLNGQPIPSANSNDTKPFTSLAINKKRTNIIAFGNATGQIQLWNVPWNNIATQDYANVYGQKKF